MKSLNPLALAIAALVPTLASAAGPLAYDDQLKLDDLVVTSARLPQTRSEATSLTTVFTRDDIDRLQPSTVADLLSRVPGVQIGQSGGRGSITGLYVRGTKSAQTLVLIDGQRVNNASGGAAPLEYLSVEQIERVEVSRGANSVIFGSEAMGGVIQIFTRRGQSEGLQPRVRMAYGNRSTWERSAGISGGNGATRFSLNASAEDTDGTNRTDAEQGPNSDHDAYRNNGLSLNLSHRFNEDVEAGLSLLDQRGETEYDLGYMGSYPYDEFELKSYASYLAAQINDTWNSRLELGHSESRRFFRADDSTAKDSLSTYRDTVNWLNDLRLNAEHSLTLGAEWYEDSLNSNTAYAEDRRWNRAAYVQHRFSGEHFSTELGVRHDDNEQFGHENSWRGALTLPLDTRNQLVFSYSEGFRAPTFMDLYYPYSANPNLQPERSKSYEVQWRSQLAERTRLEASIYRTDIEDAIVLDSSWTPMNISEARINGFEAALSHELMGWHGELGVSVIDPRDRDTGKTLSRRARRTLSLDLDRQFGAVSVGASWRTVSRAYSDEANTRELAGYGVLGVRSSWQVSDEIELGLKVDNLLDKRYVLAQDTDYSSFPSVVRDYVEEGRMALLSVTWTPSL